jgi:hypothetical protein
VSLRKKRAAFAAVLAASIVFSVGAGRTAVRGAGRAAPQNLKPAPEPTLDLSRFLPAAGNVKGWTAAGDPQIFRGEALFLYIDGGAEIYHEYGFRQVLTREYANAAGSILSLEIYEMADPAAAFGAFTFKSSASGKPIDAGQGGRLEDYYLNFWKGPCLVAVTALDGSAECRAGILPLAAAVDARIKLSGERPALANAIPGEWLAGGRVVYLKGIIGLNNIHVFFPSDVFRFRDAVAVERKGFNVFVFRYGDGGEAASGFARIRKAFKDSSLHRRFRNEADGALSVSETNGGNLYASVAGDRIGLIYSPPGVPLPDSPAAILAKIK